MVEIRESATADDRRILARRHLGDGGDDDYVRTSAGLTASMAVIRIRPERWPTEIQSE